MYFTHEGYAGLSAFAKGDASASERNANFVAVGILAKREGQYGRLGRAWLLAQELEGLAKTLAKDSGEVQPLGDFWEEQTRHAGTKGEHEETQNGKGNANGGKGHSRARAISSASGMSASMGLGNRDETLPEYHPALSTLQYIDVFGPLVFRLQQAALLRKRILFVGMPPVRRMCEFGMALTVPLPS